MYFLICYDYLTSLARLRLIVIKRCHHHNRNRIHSAVLSPPSLFTIESTREFVASFAAIASASIWAAAASAALLFLLPYSCCIRSWCDFGIGSPSHFSFPNQVHHHLIRHRNRIRLIHFWRPHPHPPTHFSSPAFFFTNQTAIGLLYCWLNTIEIKNLILYSSSFGHCYVLTNKQISTSELHRIIKPPPTHKHTHTHSNKRTFSY